MLRQTLPHDALKNFGSPLAIVKRSRHQLQTAIVVILQAVMQQSQLQGPGNAPST